jgi:integrase
VTTYEVRIWNLNEHRGHPRGTSRPRSTYRLRWLVGGRTFSRSFATKALAESFRSQLVVAQREGVAFDEASGLPEPMSRVLRTTSWYVHACDFVDMKWPRAAPKHRRGIAEALAAVTPVLLATDRGAPTSWEMRRAMTGWAFNTSLRGAGTPPDDLLRAVRWLEANTVPVAALNDPVLVRKVLDQLAALLNGQPAAPTTIARKRAVFYGALRYAVELGRLESHPMDRIRWSAPRSNEEVDRRIVINPRQAGQLLAAVDEREPELTAFFGCLYYAALRPAEALHLRIDDCELPAEGWGWLHLTGSTQHAGSDWSDSGDPREDRGLKHRARSAVRDVPAAPVLVDLLRRHVAAYGVGADGRVFQSTSYRRGPVSLATYTRAWRQARERALTPAQQRSPLAKVPYHLRHAAVSLWLNSGVPATQVAEWAGHSVNVLLRVYAHCIDGHDESARRRIEAALTLAPTDGS